MLKKVPHKRKLRSIINKSLLAACIFFGTLSILFVSYFLFSGKKILASPLPLMKHEVKILPNTQDYSSLVRQALDKNSIEYTSVQPAQNNNTLVTLPSNQEIILSNQKDIEQQIASLQLIERQLTIEGKRFHRIDFRYDNPVITF